jgi:type IV pilus assembly protein PilB
MTPVSSTSDGEDLRVDARKRIGELLLDAGLVSPDQLREGLSEQQRAGGRLCYHLIRLGHVKTDDLVGFLRDQFGVAAVNLERYRIPADVLRLIPPEFAREHRVVPMHVLGNVLTVAMLDPSRAEEIGMIHEITGLEPEPVVCPQAALDAALARFYPSAGSEGDAAGGGVLDLNEEGDERHAASDSLQRGGGTGEAWLRRIILQAVRRRSREIHLEPAEEGLRARYRVAGVLQDGETAPREFRGEIARHALAVAGVGAMTPGQLPREGRFRIHARTRWLRATLAAFPTLFGERIVIRIVDDSLLARDFQELGMTREVAGEAQRLLSCRHGVVLINAPPGQGGRTLLYNLLLHLKGKGERNIMTLESQVRVPIPGISQTRAGGGSGLDFTVGLHSILLQDPDVVGVTDVPDRATMEMVFAAGRRCLVVALCDFRDNRQALEGIGDAGVGASTQALLLRGLMTQRLLPRLCGACRAPLADPVQLVEGVRDRRVEELAFFTASGCEQCGGTGRSGRVALFELLAMRGELRDRLRRGDPPQMVVEEAQRLGMWTLREDGIVKAAQGLADIGDVLEATADERAAP